MSGVRHDLGELTPAWLTGVLRERGVLGVDRVTGVEVEKIGTFSTEVWRLRLRYDGEAAGAPDTLVLKRPAPGREPRSFEAFGDEILVYRELLEGTPVRAPRFFHGAADDAGGALLLLEDVPGLLPFSFRDGPGEEHARLGLEQLACLHAHWWGRVGDVAGVPRLADPGVRASFGRSYDAGWAFARGFYQDAVPAFVPIGDRLVGRLAESLRPLAEPATLLHGDAHAENLPLMERPDTGTGVCMLDWAGARLGHASFDVAVFVVMSFPVEARRIRERSLVALHAEAARALGVECWPDPWADYRLGVLRRAARIVEIAPGWPWSDPVSQRAFRMVAERCAQAAADLAVTDLIP